MSGTRYEDWHHTRYEGDVDAGKALLPLGRKVLGFAVQQAKVNGLQTHKYVHRLPNGGTIVGEINGGIPRLTISVPPSEPSPQPRRLRDGFVVWAKDSDQPAGIDPEHPQQILRPEWRTFFYDSDVAGYEGFPFDKGVYAPEFPPGLLYAGNIDWMDSDGVRFSWYGPSSRYWFDDWRLPRAQYGKYVFCLGRILLDVDAYANSLDEPFGERYVLGAARDGMSLLVVMADLPAEIPSNPPASPSAEPDGWSTPSYPTADIPVAVRRFTLTWNPAEPHPMKYGVGGHEDVWAGMVPRGCAPWFFDAEATTAVTYLPPESAEFTMRGSTTFYPSTSNTCLRLDVASGNVGASAVSLGPGTAVAPIAEEAGEVLSIVRKTHAGYANALFYRLDGADYLAFSVRASPSVTRYDRRHIIWADLRERILLVWADSIDATTGFLFEASIRICRGGAESVIWEDSTGVATIGAGDAIHTMLEAFAARDVAPSGLAHLNAFGVMLGGWPGGTHNAQLALLQAHGFMPFRKSDTFGETRFVVSGSSWTNFSSKAGIADDIAANTHVDQLGHTTLPGFATIAEHSVFSYPMNVGINGRRVVLSHATNGDLAALTGVAGVDTTEAGILGNDATYHPIWPLGQMPQEP